MKRFVALTVAGALTLASLAGCQKASTAEKQPAGGETTESQAENGGNEKKSTDAKLLKTSMPTAWDETHGYTQALIAMNAYLDEASGGRLQLDIYAGGQLGDEVSVFESMQMGTIDCAVFNAASLSNFTHVLEAFDLPYMWVDDTGVVNTKLQNTVVSSDFAKGYLDKVYAETSVKPVGFLYNASRDFFLKKELKSLADAPSIKLRSMTAQMHLDMYTAMGFVATPLGYSEVYNAMQTGVVDGFEDTACTTITSGTYETAKYVVKSGHATASPLFVCSGITWDGLSQEEKDWLTEAVEKGRQACYDTFETAQENAYKTFEEKGLQVSVIDHDAAVAACRPVIDKYCENEDSKAIYDYVMKVREELGIPNN